MRLPPLRYLHFSTQNHTNSLNQTLKSLCFSGRLKKAVDILCSTRSQLEPETYSLLLQQSIFSKEFKKGKQIHAHMITFGFSPNQYLQTKLVILHAKNGDMEIAQKLFDEIPVKSLVSWNTMIAGYVQKGLEEMGLDYYYMMRWYGLTPDQYTFASVFRACATLASLEQGTRAHAVLVKTNVKDNVVVDSALMDMYFKCSSPLDGHRVFDKVSERNIITWTVLISGYGQNGRVDEVLELFDRMIGEGFKPNYITLLAVLSACSYGGLVDEGWRHFYSMSEKYGIRPRIKHYAAMVDLLGRAGRLYEAYEFVQTSPCKEHSVVWGALLGACRVHGNLELVKVAAQRFFVLEPENAGKYVVLSNAYAAFGLWKNVKEVREGMRESGVKKEPGCSWIEIRREVHIFLVGDESHKQSEQIYEMLKKLTSSLKDAGYVPDMSCGD